MQSNRPPTRQNKSPGRTPPQKAPGINWEKMTFRINPKPRPVKRYETGLKTFDEWTKGLPYGFTLFMGEAGAGKSMIAREIAKSCEGLCLYFTCEVTSDAPPNKDYPNVYTIDYTSYRPNYRRALQELEIFIDKLKPDLVIIDSVTKFFGVTKKAVAEADVAGSVSEVHLKYDGILPIIGISEIRGNGNFSSAAGGRGVEHANSMLIDFECHPIRYPSEEELYGKELGDDIYLLKVKKDKFNKSKTKLAKVELKRGQIIVKDAKEGRQIANDSWNTE